jgi:hypothetical protein
MGEAFAFVALCIPARGESALDAAMSAMMRVAKGHRPRSPNAIVAMATSVPGNAGEQDSMATVVIDVSGFSAAQPSKSLAASASSQGLSLMLDRVSRR